LLGFSVATGAETTVILRASDLGGDAAVGPDGSLYLFGQGPLPSSPVSLSRLKRRWGGHVDLHADRGIDGGFAIQRVFGLSTGTHTRRSGPPSHPRRPRQAPASGKLLALDSTTGANRWTRMLDGSVLGGPVGRGRRVDRGAGGSALSSAREDDALVLGPDGTMRNQVDLGGYDPNGVAKLFCAHARRRRRSSRSRQRQDNDGALVLVNLDASVTPSTRWQWSNTTDTFAAGTIDSSGTLIVATGTTVYGLDPAGGIHAWRLEKPRWPA